MATTFASLYRLIRAPLGDTDSQRIMYSDEVLQDHIRLNILALNEANIQEDGSSGSFAIELTTIDKARIIFRVIIGILSPQYNYFSYRTPIHSVTRSGGVAQLLAWVNAQLLSLEGGSFITENELEASIQYGMRYVNTLSDAIAVAQ